MALVLILDALEDVLLFVAVDAALDEFGAKFLEQFRAAGDVARLEEGGLREHVDIRLLDRPGNRAGGVADLEADVPEHVEDHLDDLVQAGGDFLRFRGVQEHDVHVAEGVELVAPIAADGHQRELPQFADARRPCAAAPSKRWRSTMSTRLARWWAISRPPPPA